MISPVISNCYHRRLQILLVDDADINRDIIGKNVLSGFRPTSLYASGNGALTFITATAIRFGSTD